MPFIIHGIGNWNKETDCRDEKGSTIVQAASCNPPLNVCVLFKLTYIDTSKKQYYLTVIYTKCHLNKKESFPPHFKFFIILKDPISNSIYTFKLCTANCVSLIIPYSVKSFLTCGNI